MSFASEVAATLSALEMQQAHDMDRVVRKWKPIYEVKVLGTTVEYTNDYKLAQDAFKASHSNSKQMFRQMNGVKHQIQ